MDATIAGRWAVHLNLHKSCERSANPVVFRTSIFLSRGATVISEHSHPSDEVEYAGLIHFATVAQIPAVLEREWIPAQPPTPFGDRRRRSMQVRAEVREQYAERFAPQRIFERAGVYASLLSFANGTRSLDDQRMSAHERKAYNKQVKAHPVVFEHVGRDDRLVRRAANGRGARKHRMTTRNVSSGAHFALLLHGRLGTLTLSPSASLESIRLKGE